MNSTRWPETAQERQAARKDRLRLRSGELAEQRHQVYDLDCDSLWVIPGCSCPDYCRCR